MMNEIASYSNFLWRLEIHTKPSKSQRLHLIVTGIQQENKDGNLTSIEYDLGKLIDGDRFIRSLGRKLVDHSREIGVSAKYSWDSVCTNYPHPAQEIWSIAWTNDQNDPNKALAWLLEKLSDEQIIHLRKNIEHPANFEFLRNLNSIFDFVEYASYPFIDLLKEIGSPTTLEWFDKSATFARAETEKLKTEKLMREQEKIHKLFGDPKFASNIEAVLKKYQDKIPPGILLHMTKFEKPKIDENVIVILAAWLRVKNKIPTSQQFSMSKTSILPGYLIVLKWIFEGQETKVFEQLRLSSNPISLKILQKLKALSEEGQKSLNKNLIKHSIGVAIEKFKTRFDPDLWS